MTTPSLSKKSSTWVMIPTYNERENIVPLIEDLYKQPLWNHDLNILVVDDNSPDGTADAVMNLAQRHPHGDKIHCLVRKDERGRGTAGIRGFQESLKRGADIVVEMDADFSHDPKYLPALLATLDQGADVSIGSRFVEGGSDLDRGPLRQVLSKCAGLYVRGLLGLRIKDVTSGYRGFRARVLSSIELDSLISKGPEIVEEILYRVSIRGFHMEEFPIVFVDRRAGSSKLNFAKLVEVLLAVARIRLSGFSS